MTTPITSSANPRLRQVRRLLAEKRLRQREKMFVVEGTRWMDEVAASRTAPLYWLATAGWLDQNRELADRVTALGHPPFVVEDRLFSETAGTESPAGVLAVLPQPVHGWPAQPTFLLILDQIRDPGNAGTLLRSAAAAGVEGVLLMPGTVDPINPKVVRSSMGAVLRLPLREISWDDWAALGGSCRLYLADGEAPLDYTSPDWTRPAALIVGGEARGAGRQARALAAQAVSIPMHGATESLNAAVAGSIILFEIARRRRPEAAL